MFQAIKNMFNKQNNSGLYLDPAWAAGDPREAQAALTRMQYDEWTDSFQPAEGNLLSMTTYGGREGLAPGMISGQMAAIDSNYDNAARAAGRSRSRFGMAPSPEQVTADGRGMALGKSLSQVDAINRTNDWQKNLNREIVATGLSGSAAAMKGA